MVTLCTTRLNIKKKKQLFLRRVVFMCLVRVSEQTAIISLYSTNWLVSIIEMVCVYCAVRTDFLNVLHVNFSFYGLGIAQRSVAGLSPRRPGFDPRENCRGQSGTDTLFLSSISIFPANIIPTMLHAHLHVHVALTGRINGRNLGTFQKTTLFRKSRSNGQPCTVTFPVQN